MNLIYVSSFMHVWRFGLNGRYCQRKKSLHLFIILFKANVKLHYAYQCVPNFIQFDRTVLETFPCDRLGRSNLLHTLFVFVVFMLLFLLFFSINPAQKQLIFNNDKPCFCQYILNKNITCLRPKAKYQMVSIF